MKLTLPLHLLVLFVVTLVGPVMANEEPIAVDSGPMPYTDGDQKCIGYFAAPQIQVMAMRAYPVIIIFPEWWGATDHTKRVACSLAEQGYYALVADIYGDGLVADTVDKAKEQSQIWYQDREAMVRRATAAITAVSRYGGADPDRVGLLGFCFGGTVALEVARAKGPIRGAVSVHGGLTSPNKAQAGVAPTLVLHGGADPIVPVADVQGLMVEWLAVDGPIEFVSYPGALHAFTNPAAAERHATLPVVDYDADAAKQAEAAWERFFMAQVRPRPTSP